jgi:hypothetical protein
MQTRLNKTSICSVLCVDIVGHSRKPDAEQIQQRERFNTLVEAALQDIPKNERAILDTGDGAAIAFFGAPEDALTVALLIRDGISDDHIAHPGQPIALRAGINLGPVRVVPDINGTLNIIGDGLNVGLQIMGFAAPGRIMISRSYFEVIAPGNSDIPRMFSYFGVKADQDVRDHEMYVLGRSDHQAKLAWKGMFDKVRFGLRPLTWLRIATLGILFLMVIVLFALHDDKLPVALPLPDDMPEKGIEHSEPEDATQRRSGGHPGKPAGRDAFSCTEAERMLSHCN